MSGPPSSDGWVEPVEQTMAWVGEIAGRNPFTTRRGLDRIRPGLEVAASTATVAAALADPTTAVVVEHGEGAPLGITSRRSKPLESELLGVRTAAVSELLVGGGASERPRLLRRLLDRVLAEAAADGDELLVARVDADDVVLLAAAQAAGFTVHETTLTWLADSEDAGGDPGPAEGIDIEVVEGDVAGALAPDVVEALAARTATWQLSHLAADPLLDPEAVARFYGRWIHNIASGRWSDCLTIARHRGRVVGVQSEVTDAHLLDTTGVDLRAGEWIVVLEPGLGAGRSLMAAVGHHRHPGGRYHSWETQARNLPTIRCIEQTGIARPIRAAHTLHAWPRRR